MKKYYTTLEQSVILEKVIDPNTADMYYENGNKEQPTIRLNSYGHIKTNDDIPCWSVGALIDLIPYCCVKSDPICERYYVSCGSQETDSDALVGALVEMICILKERNML